MISVNYCRYVMGEYRKAASLGDEGVSRERIIQLLVHGAEGYFRSHEGLFEMACRAANSTLDASGVSRSRINVVLLGSNSLRASAFEQDFGHRLISELGLCHAYVQQTGFQNCADAVPILRTAKALIDSGADEHVLVLIADDIGAAGVPRILKGSYLHSDGAAAALVTRQEHGFTLGLSKVVHAPGGGVSDVGPHDLAPHLPWLLNAALGVARSFSRDSAQPDFVITHNMNRLYHQMIANVFGVPVARVFSQPGLGHFLAADVLVNMKDMVDQGTVRNGDEGLIIVPTNRSIGVMEVAYRSAHG